MNEARLIDMLGLSGEPANDDRLDELLFRLESEALIASAEFLKETLPCHSPS